jgi:DNA repair exonuclease SbcCD ATPase subunit
MRWSHVFSYGANNKINFSNNELLQLVGRNGHGKSSIALILEEVLFNKNSKGIKKANILNRYSKSKAYTIELEFTEGYDAYEIKTVRGSTQNVKLLKNGNDISAHTSTATYKLIEDIVGFDHKAFTQIVYQSSAFNLEFLTATDTNRKKFLIDLLKLTRYSKALEHYKELAKELTKDVDVLNTKFKLASAILNKYTPADLTLKSMLPEVVVSQAAIDEYNLLNSQLKTIDKTNATITQNNTYKDILNTISIPDIPIKPEDITPLRIRQSELLKRITVLKATATGKVVHTCPTCKQGIDTTHLVTIKNAAQTELDELLPEQTALEASIALNVSNTTKYNKAIAAQAEWEKYYALVDKTMTSILLDKASIEARIKVLNKQIEAEKLLKASTDTKNIQIASHNARVEVISAQLATAQEESTVISMELTDVSTRAANIQVLVKTFSTSGLVAYKIECLVKDLEELTNTYLQDMSDGRFQLTFKISASDKLDVIITDNGTDIDINALSNGELARVNISTLLAIRKLMQGLSNTRINLLILDETVESLDVDGKEKLVEVLLKEEYLNTVLVSHGFTHPLLDKLTIVKENNISRIE